MSFDILAPFKNKFLAILRHAAGGWAIYLAQRGYLAGDAVQTFTGAIMFLGTIGFSIADKLIVDALKSELNKFLAPSIDAAQRPNVT